MHESGDVVTAAQMGTNRQSTPRDQVRAHIDQLKRDLLAWVVVAFVALFALVAHHVVGVTSHPSTPPTTASQVQSPGSSGFFGNGNGDSSSLGPSGSAPVLGSGGS